MARAAALLLLCAFRAALTLGDSTSLPSVPEDSNNKTLTGSFTINLAEGSDQYSINVDITQCAAPGTSSVHSSTGEETPPARKVPAGIGAEAGARADLGSEDNPAESCAAVPRTGIIYIKTPEPVRVRCATERKGTCLLPPPSPEDIPTSAFDIPDKEFWLSRENNIFSVDKFYGINVRQIKYLLDRSVEVWQKIRYHCLNTEVNKDGTRSLQVLGWNDQLVGAEPTPRSPVAYRLGTDGCKDSNVWNHTDIELEVKSVNRLPVTDFYIRDKKDAGTLEKKAFLELQELCFYHEYEDGDE